jgi:hypothetical protein
MFSTCVNAQMLHVKHLLNVMNFRTLCDIKQSGKLNSEQFALSMWLINQKLQGIDPPPALTPEMVPPSFRTKPPVDGVIVSTTKFCAICFLYRRFCSNIWFYSS